MAFLVPNEGEDFCLEKIINFTDLTDQNLVLKLFENDITPSETDTLASYTEVSDGSYNSTILTGSNWIILNGDSSYAQQSFTIGGAQVIYGCYLTNFAGTILVVAERFTETVNIGLGGGTINVTPTINLD